MRPRFLSALVVAGLAGCGLFGPKDSGPSEPAYDDFAIVKTADDDQSFSAAGDGTNYLVAVTSTGASGSRAIAQLMSATGTIGSAIDLGPNLGDIGAVAFDGAKYLAVYQLGVGAGGSDIWGQFITTGGAKSGAPISITSSGNGPGVYSLTYGSGSYLLTYARREFSATIGDSAYMSYARIISTSGSVGAEIPLSFNGAGTAAAFDGTNFLVVYNQRSSGNVDIRSRIISPAGFGSADASLVNVVASQSLPVAVSYNGSNYMAAVARPGASPTVYAVAVSKAGVAGGVSLSTPAGAGSVSFLAATNVGTNFYLSWLRTSSTTDWSSRAMLVNGAVSLAITPVDLVTADDATTRAYVGLMGASNTSVLGIVNRKVNGQWNVYAKFISP